MGKIHCEIERLGFKQITMLWDLSRHNYKPLDAHNSFMEPIDSNCQTNGNSNGAASHQIVFVKAARVFEAVTR